MADAFPVSGSIDPTSFPHLLVDLHRQGATGSLKVNGPTHPKALYFRGGRVLFGSSNDPRDQLGAILIESGKITREQLDEVNAKVGPGNPLAKVLAESGFVNQRELGEAARVKVERILSDVISWESGSFEFEDGILPKGAVDLKLSTGRLVLAAVQRIGERSFVLRHLDGDMGVVLEPAPDSEAALADTRAEVWPLLERLDGERSLQDAVALTRLDEFEAAKTACAMLFMGIVRKKEASDELDLAEEARSGFGEPAEEPSAPAAEPEALVVPSEAEAPAFPALDAEPLSAEPVEESASATVAFLPDSEPEPEPNAPVPMAVPDDSPLPNLEPTGFAFVEPEAVPAPEAPPPVMPEPPPVMPEPPPVIPEPVASPEPTVVMAPEPTVALPPEPTVVLPPEPAPPEPTVALSPEPTVAMPAEPVGEEAPSPEPLLAPPPDEPPPPPPEPVVAEEAPAPSFAVETPEAGKYDTVPGDQPAYVPPPAAAPEVPAEEPASPDSSSPSPSKEDLAALDALLNPSASGDSATPVERPRSEKWEPQFRTGTTPPRRAVGRNARSYRAPLIGAAVVFVLAAGAVGYFLLRGPSAPAPAPATPPPTAAPTTAPTPTLSAPATVAAAPTTTPDTPPAAAPAPVTAPAAAPAPTPTPVPVAPPAAAAPPPPAAPTGDPRALLRQGALDQAARGFASSLAAGPAGRFGIQALVACSPETVHKAVQAVSGDDLFILPVNYKGRDCHRICWGVYPDRAAAEAAAGSFPTYFRQNRISPRIQPLTDLLP